MSNTESILKGLYTTIFAQKFSNTGNELAACDNFGNISVYKFSSIFKLLY